MHSVYTDHTVTVCVQLSCPHTSKSVKKRLFLAQNGTNAVYCTQSTVKPVFFTCPLFREFREPGKFVKIRGRKNLNTVAFQCSRKQKRQNYRVQNNYIDSNAKIKGSTVLDQHSDN